MLENAIKIAIDPLLPPPSDWNIKSGHKFGGESIF